MRPSQRLLLVGWDSADWKIIQPLIDSGAMPVLARIVEKGASGTLTTLEPQLSPMLWTSIATGRMAYHHGVPGFTEVDPGTGRVVPVSAATRTCRTLWEILGDRGLRSHVVSWFATHGEQLPGGHVVSNLFCHLPGVGPDQEPANWPPAPPGTYWPPGLGDELNDLRVSLHDIDPDQILRLFVPDGHTIDQGRDRRLWALAQKLAEGFSTHSAAVHLMETRPEWDFMAVYYRALDEICHMFMPYHPPRMEGIPEADFELYKQVVTGAYRLHDLLLGRLLQLAGPDAAVMVVSDHGFHSDHLRPRFTPRVPAGITVWHRPQGVFAAAGPGFKRDELVFGANLLDVTPTILHWFGLPVGADMEGRVLEDAFSSPRPVERVPTWERPDARRGQRLGLGAEADRALLDQFVALGYIDEVPDDPGQAAAETNRENDWNMARAMVHGQRYEQALPLLESCFHSAPYRADFAQALAACQMQLGLLDQADATIERARDTFSRTEQADLVKASIAIQKEDFPAALEALERVKAKVPDEPQLQRMLGQCYSALRRWPEAEEAVARLLAADPHSAQGHLLRTRIRLHTNRAAEAVESALDAIGLQYGNPRGHFLLGMALVQERRLEDALRPLTNCLRLAPEFLTARRVLARVYRRLGRTGEAEEEEKRTFDAMRAIRSRRLAREASLREAVRARAEGREELDRKLKASAEQKAAELAAIEPLDLLVVSGLPRSGTSLMMQMLRAGGIEPLTDGRRTADEDNPEGYWEWEDIKKLPRNPRLIEKAAGKVVKVISALLPSLPPPHRYTVIYMVRPVEEVVNSQWAMLARQGRSPRSERRHLIEVQEKHSVQIRAALAASNRVRLCEVSFPDLIADPGPVIARLAELLPGRFRPGPEVAACVRPSLYRNRNRPGS